MSDTSKPVPVKSVAVHFIVNVMAMPVCGERRGDPWMTLDQARVTCERCKRSMK